MERVAVEIHPAQGLITHPTAFLVALRVESGPDRQARFCFRIADQVHDGYSVEHGAASPVLGNEAKHTMLNLIPLARAGGEMRDMDREMQRIGEPLEFGFPQAHATAVTAATIGRDIEFGGVLV